MTLSCAAAQGSVRWLDGAAVMCMGASRSVFMPEPGRLASLAQEQAAASSGAEVPIMLLFWLDRAWSCTSSPLVPGRAWLLYTHLTWSHARQCLPTRQVSASAGLQLMLTRAIGVQAAAQLAAEARPTQEVPYTGELFNMMTQ